MRRTRWRWILFSLLLLGAIGCWFADSRLKAHGHPGLVTFAGQWWRNYPKSFSAEPPVISITVDEAGMEHLYSVVERARTLGVIQEEGNDYVKGDFRVEMPGGAEGTGAFKGKLRIKGKMTDHVEGKKWSFRVVAKKDGGFLGMKRFSLQHPGTRNYLCDQFYHELMKGEGLIALRYGFCKVKLNEEDLGVYAYEEHFGPELLENNGRLPGPIVRLDPSLFWLHRTQGLDGSAKVDDAYGAYQAASLDAFGTDDLAQDPEQKKYFEQAVALMQGFRTGRFKASEVFDVERTGKRLAMLDLVGGHQSMDWSDVKFYFDPVRQKLEPISYESFSANRITELAGAYKATGSFSECDDLHTALFKDPDILGAYVRNLERYSRKQWLDSAFAALQGHLDTASATLYAEFPYKELDRSIYYANQQAIHRLLDVPKGAHVYHQRTRGDTVTLAFVPIESLPIQVDSLMLANGRRIAPMHATLIPCRERGRTGVPLEVNFLIDPGSATGHSLDSLLAKGTEVMYRVLGASRREMMPVFPFILSVSSAQDELLVGRKPNAQEFPFMAIDEVLRTITIKPGAWTIDRTVVVPPGYRCVATGPLKLDIVNGAELISYAPLTWNGIEDGGIRIFSTDSSSHGVHVIGAAGLSTLAHVEFRSLTRYKYDQERSGDVSFHSSPVEIDHCWFHGTGATLLDISTATARVTATTFAEGSDQLELHFANAILSGSTFAVAHDDAISCEGGTLNASDVNVRSAMGVAFKGTKAARITLDRFEILRTGSAFEGREGSKLYISNGRIDEVGSVAEAKKKEMRYGPVKVEFKNVQGVTEQGPFKCGAGSTIILDGKKVGETKAAKGT